MPATDQMASVYETRRQNLKLLGADHTMIALAKLLGYSTGSYLSQCVMDPPRRRIPEDLARRIETVLGMDPGEMDSDMTADA